MLNLLVRLIVKQIVKHQNCMIVKRYYCRTYRVPEGSAISAWLFNLFVNKIIQRLHTEVDNLTKIKDFSDNMVLFGRFDFSKLKAIFEDFNLTFDDSKCDIFRMKVKNLPQL
jgi:hypothetical protein